MRNLIITSVSILNFPLTSDERVVSITGDNARDSWFILTDLGTLYISQPPKPFSTISLSAEELLPPRWFSAVFVMDIHSIVCLSHNGQIMTVDIETFAVEEEGCVEEGILAAAWSPDQSRLLIISGNNTFLLLSSSFDALQEVSLSEPLNSSSFALISWRGAGDLVSLYFQSSDAHSSPSCVYIYSNNLDLVAIGKNITESPEESQLKGLFPALAFCPNGSIIALAQQLPRRKLQIIFLEPNGLRHGEFDVKVDT